MSMRCSAFRTIYKIFSSTTLTIVLLLFLCLIYLIGTVFPQGVGLDEYIKVGGKLLFFAKYFSALDIFNSWFLFLTLSFLLLNFLFCTIGRIKGSKGLKKFFSIIYHLIFLLIILMLCISDRVSIEDEITVEEGNSKQVELRKGEKVEVYLNGFYISYTEIPDYISERGLWNRLKIIFPLSGPHKIVNLNELHWVYRDFIADVEVNYNGKKYNHLLRVNNSLVFASYSLNLYSFEHSIILKINDRVYNVTGGEEFFYNTTEKYKSSEVFSGNIIHIDGTESVLSPEIFLYRGTNKNSWEKLPGLKKGVPHDMDGTKYEFINYNQKVTFGIKYDPVVFYLKILSFLAIFFMLPAIIKKMR